MIKYGLKLWSINDDLYDEAIELYTLNYFDYIEILFIPDKTSNINKLIKAQIPIIIHAPTSLQGMNLGSDRIDKNIKLLQKTIEFSNKVNSKFIILHPDYGNVSNLLKVLSHVKCDKFVIENMSKYGISESIELLLFSFEEIKSILNIAKIGFCLDLSHAIKTSVALHQDLYLFIDKMLSLKPQIVHISDGKLSNPLDEHIDLGEGDYNLEYLKNIIFKNPYYLTFETPKVNGLKNDINNIDYFRKL